MEQAVVAQLVAVARRCPPVFDARPHGVARQLQVEASFQSMPIQRRNGGIEMRRQGIVVGQAHRRLAALRPGETVAGQGDAGPQPERQQQQVHTHHHVSSNHRDRHPLIRKQSATRQPRKIRRGIHPAPRVDAAVDRGQARPLASGCPPGRRRVQEASRFPPSGADMARIEALPLPAGRPVATTRPVSTHTPWM